MALTMVFRHLPISRELGVHGSAGKLDEKNEQRIVAWRWFAPSKVESLVDTSRT